MHWSVPLQAEAARISTTDPVSQALVAGLLVGVFVLLTLEAAHRLVVVLGAVAVLWLITYFTPYHLLSFEQTAAALDLNVLVLLAGMMAVVGVLKTTGIFEWAVARLLGRAGGRPVVVLGLVAWFTALTSAFLDNVTTVVFMTPMAIGLARQLKLAPAAVLMPMVMASNIGGTATLIGDPPNIMIGSGAGLSFIDFVENLTPPLLVMMFWLVFYSERYYRRDLAAAGGAGAPEIVVPALTDPKLARWMMAIGAGVLIGFLTHHLTHMPAAVPATIGAAAALIVQDRLYVRRRRPSAAERVHGVLAVTERDIEWPTLAFFGFLFIIVGAGVETGLIGTMASALQDGISAGAAAFGLSPTATLFFAALIICWVSGVMSALIDNIPFVAVAIPVVAQLAGGMTGDSEVLWWALSLGACLGGNATPIGASANVTTVGMAEREGARISFRAFARFGGVVAFGTLVISSAWLALFVFAGKATADWSALGIAAILAASRAAFGARKPS
ncbi:MAG: citrate transporter [Gemmatimonadaceae bacterium]|nr:citrate transporter [Gemmatimonadaceae bacterium]